MKDHAVYRILSAEMAEWVKAFATILSSIPRTHTVEDTLLKVALDRGVQ